MRKSAIYLLLVLWSAVALAQDEPQWKVIKHVVLTNQTQQTSRTLLVPTEPGVYRLNLYFSVTGGGLGDAYFYEAQIGGTDISGAQLSGGSLGFCQEPGA